MTVAVFPETLLTTDHLSKSKWSPSSPPHPFYSSFNFHIKYFVLVIISGRFEVLTVVLLRIRSSVMWLCVTGWVVSEVLKDHNMFILQYQVVQECLTLEDEDTMILWNVANHLPDTLSYPTITKFPIATGLLNPLQFNKQHNIVSTVTEPVHTCMRLDCIQFIVACVLLLYLYQTEVMLLTKAECTKYFMEGLNGCLGESV